jgi:hypothetical protein
VPRSAPPLVPVLALALAAPLAGAVAPPVPLRTPPLLVPFGLAGSALSPEAAVRVSIDARGVVSRVDVLSIEPSSENDERYREELVETLSRWRYAPQRRDGVAEATALEWRVRFPAGSGIAAGERPGGGPLVVTAFEDRDAEQRRSEVLALPVRQRLAILESEVAAARAILDPSRTREVATARCVVRSDADDAQVATIVANNLEALFNVLAEELLPGIPLYPERYKLQVVVYRDRASYARLLEELPVYEWSEGFYSPAGLIAFHLELPTSDAATSVLLHEATHAFLDRYIVRRGVALPRWLGEGFAEYVGNSAIRKGRLEPGRAVRGKFELWRGGVARVGTKPGVQIDAAKAALRAGKGLGLVELISASPETFYGEAHDLYYGSAWLLVHHLRDGGEGWSRERFPRLLLYLAEGFTPAAAVATLYGPLEAADAAFRDYVRKF